MGEKFLSPRVQQGALGLVLSACFGFTGCQFSTPSAYHEPAPSLVVYADQSEGDFSNTPDAHRDIHSELLNFGVSWGNSHAMNRSEISKMEFGRYGSGSIEVDSNHGYMYIRAGVEWHGHEHATGILADLKDDSYVYGLRHWNLDLYLDYLAEMDGDSLVSVLFTYVIGDTVLVGMGTGAPYISGDTGFARARDQTKTDVERLGTLEIGAPRKGWRETVAVADVSGVLFTHHPDYGRERQVSFSVSAMRPLVQDWLALQDEATIEVYHQADGEIVFMGERLGMFTDGERLLEVTKLKLGSGEPIRLRSFHALVHGDAL